MSVTMAGEQGVNVLVVDDHSENLLALESVLGDKGLNLVKAQSGREALRHCLGQDFSVILMDVHMPGMDGFETAGLLRERERTRLTPIIFLTGSLFGMEEQRVSQGYSVGAVDYILKPFVPEVLKAKVAVFVELFRKGQEVKRQAEALSVCNLQLEAQLADIEQLSQELDAANQGLEEKVQQRTAALEEEIAERRRAEEHVQRQVRRLAALRTIDMAITGSLDLRLTFNVLLDEAMGQLSVDAASVLMLNPHTQYLEYAAGRGFRTPGIRSTKLRLGEDLAGKAAMEGRVMRLADVSVAGTAFTRSSLLSEEGFTAYYIAPLVAKGHVKGVLETFFRQAFDPDQEWLDFLETLAAQAAVAIDNATLFNDLQRSNIELALAYDATLEAWCQFLDLRDKETEGHSRRVAELAVRLGRAMGMSEAELVHVRRGALLHDIGKLGIPDSILLKRDPLTDEEYEVVRKHPVHAFEMLSPIAFLHPTLDIPYCHHEKWDGTGYPRGLKGEQIPLAARISAVVDVWEALCSDRSYRPAWPEEKALEHIAQGAAAYFDPRVVEVFLSKVASVSP